MPERPAGDQCNQWKCTVTSHPELSHDPARPAGLASRRNVLLGLGATGLLAGCSTIENAFQMPQIDYSPTGTIRPRISVDKRVTGPDIMYAAYTDEGFNVPQVPFEKVAPEFRRQIVVDPTGEAPGTIVVRLQERHLYFVQPGGDAIRYGVGIGKSGFEWSGRANIQYGRKWPTWTPPPEMIGRKPELAKWRGGQPGGLDNPLGARALYIFKDGKDTGYRVHGSPEWWSIGQAVSSGCVRLINQDIIDLYSRVNGKTPIVVA